MFYKVVAFRNLVKFTGKRLCSRLFLIKLQYHHKETPAQVFSCEICEISLQNFYEYLFCKYLQAAEPVLTIFNPLNATPQNGHARSNNCV